MGRRALGMVVVGLVVGCADPSVVLGPVDGAVTRDDGAVTLPDGAVISDDGAVVIGDDGAVIGDDGGIVVTDGGIITPCGTLGTPRRLEDLAPPVHVGFTATNVGEDFLVAWTQASASGEFPGWLARHDAAGGWSAASSFTNDSDTDEIQLVLDASGDGFIGWLERPATLETNVWAAAYSATSGVSAATEMGPAPRHSSVIDGAISSGGAVLGWNTSTDERLMVASLGATGFDTPAPVSSNSARSPQLAIDDAGNTFATWMNGFQAWVARRPAGGAWEAPLRIDPVDESPTTSEIASLPDGALVVWGDLATDAVIRWSRYRNGTGWSAPATLSLPGPSYQGRPTLHIARDGHGFLTWIGSLPDESVYILAPFDPSSGFGAPTRREQFDDIAVGATRSLATRLVAGVLESACIARDGTWSSWQPVSHTGEVLQGIAAVTPTGRGAYVYRAGDDLWAVTLEP